MAGAPEALYLWSPETGAVESAVGAAVAGQGMPVISRAEGSRVIAESSSGDAGSLQRHWEKWCPESDLNQRPTAYEAVALPLSYQGTLAVLKGASEKLAD